MAAGISGVHSPDHILSFLSEHHTHLPDGIPIVYVRHTVFKAGVKEFCNEIYSNQSYSNLNILQHIPTECSSGLHVDPIIHKCTFPLGGRVPYVSIMMEPSFVMIWNSP